MAEAYHRYNERGYQVDINELADLLGIPRTPRGDISQPGYQPGSSIYVKGGNSHDGHGKIEITVRDQA